MNEVKIFNQTNQEIIELDQVYGVLRYALEKEKLEHVLFNVIVVNNNYIHQLNKDYRDIDRETDVITFALEDEKTMIVPQDNRVLGDIYISIDKASEQANEYGHSLLRELSFLAVHGFYHLLGYDHMTPEEESIMCQKQEAVLNACKLER